MFFIAQVLGHMILFIVFIFTGTFVSIYVCIWHHFCTEEANDGYVTLGYGVEVKFDQSSNASYHDQNLIEGKLGYVENIQEIMQIDLLSFQCAIFRCKWWDIFNWRNAKEDHDSGIWIYCPANKGVSYINLVSG
jgi:hypothetical protein